MTTAFRFGCVVGAVLLFAASSAWAQDKAKAKKKAPKAAAAEVAATAEGDAASPEEDEAVAAVPEAPTPIPETSVDLCLDKLDNDADGFIDCADQDCQIYAVCVRPVVVATPAPEQAPPSPPPIAVPTEERGRMCFDGLDNDHDGLVDCFEKSCHATWRCRREIYYRPRDPNKAPGLVVSLGAGVALPNFRGNDTSTSSPWDDDVAFQPDVGGMLDLRLGVIPLRWLGVGLYTMLAGTDATNRYSSWGEEVNQNHTKYEAFKVLGHVGGFVRLQLPFDRFVPYLEIEGGYTYARQYWEIYDASVTWDDIDYGDDNDVQDPIQKTETYRHFTMALAPGFDVFVSDRLFAVGLRAWMPFWATSQPDVDNVGVMLNFTFTPMWREPLQMRPEYANPASTLEEETSEDAPAAQPEPQPEPQPATI